MDQLPTSSFTFSPEEIEFLRSKRLFSHIAQKVVSTRSQGRVSVSAKYVSMVINGRVQSESDTVSAIKTNAKELLTQLNFQNEPI